MRARKSDWKPPQKLAKTILWEAASKRPSCDLSTLEPSDTTLPHKLRIYSALASSHGSILDCSLADWPLAELCHMPVEPGEAQWFGFSIEEAGCLGHEFLPTYKGHFIGTIGKPESMTYLLPYSTPAAWAIKWECIKETVWAIKPLNWRNVGNCGYSDDESQCECM